MRVALFLLTTGYCVAQSLSFGVVGGVRTTDDINFAATSESKRYIVGPMVDVGLPFGFGAEFDALYAREGFRADISTPITSALINSRSGVWQLPFMVKHSIPFPVVKPFAEIGFSTRIMNGTLARNETTEVLANGTETVSFNTRGDANWPKSYGLVMGGGVRLHAARLQLMPQVRYTHWSSTPILLPFGDGPTIQSTQNEFDVLVGIGWKAAGR